MKKAIIIICAILLLAGITYASSMKWAIGLTGGGNALDGVVSPAAQDVAIVITSPTSTSSKAYSLYVAISGVVAESSPTTIVPNTNVNSVTWWLVDRYNALPMWGGAASTCTTGQLVSSVSATGLITCQTPSTLNSAGTVTAVTFSGTNLSATTGTVTTLGGTTGTYTTFGATNLTATTGTITTLGATNLSATTGTVTTLGGTTGTYTTFGATNLTATTGTVTTLAATNFTVGGSSVLTTPTTTGFLIYTNGSGSIVPSGTSTGLLGASAGTMGLYSSWTTTITDWRQDLTVSLTTSTTTGGKAMFVIPYAISTMAVSAATDSTGTTAATIDWKKCGTSNWTTCTSILSSTISPTNTTGVLATMASTTVGAGERMIVSWGTVTVGSAPGAIVTFATGTASGVQ